MVTDGLACYDPAFAFPGIPLDELVDQLDETGKVLLPYNPLLIQIAGKRALFDTGLGALAEITGDPAGRLQDSLTALNLSPDEIDIVIISHAHPDHIGGLTRSEGGGQVPIFARARHYIWRGEWEFWTSERQLSQLPEFLAGPARVHLPPLLEAGLVEFVDHETELLPGVRLFPAPGHTPGHMAVAITASDSSALCVGDALLHELNVQRIEAVTPIDMNPSLMVESRKRLLEKAERDGSLLMAYHFRRPGRVEKAGRAYRFVPGAPPRTMRTASSLRERTSSF